MAAPIKNLRDGTLKIQVDNDGGGNAGEVEVTLDNGDLSWTESRPVDMISDRGTLSHARRGAEQLIELTFSIMYTDHLDPNSVTPTVYEALTRQGAAASWVSQNFDSDDYAVNLEFTIADPAGGTSEVIDFDRFNVTGIEFSEGTPSNTLTVTGTAPLWWVDFWWKAGMGLNPLVGIEGVFTRAGTATYIDDSFAVAYARSGQFRSRHHPNSTGAAGLLEAQRTNLATYSEELSNAIWVVENVSVAVDQVAAPDGYTTADKLTDDATVGAHDIVAAITMTADANYAASCFLKNGDAGFAWVMVNEAAAYGNRAVAYLNLSTGAVTSFDNGTASVVAARVEELAGGVYRLELVASVGNGATANHMRIGLSESGSSIDANSYGGTGKYIYAWGAQLEDGAPFASSYIPTTVYNLSPDGYLDLPGTAANYASTPDAAALDITGDIDIRARIAADDWTPASAETIAAKWTASGNQRSWVLVLATDGTITMSWTTDGSGGTTVSVPSSVATGFTNGTVHWVRVTVDVSTGNVNFYTSDDGENWTQLGAADQGGAGATSIYSSSAVLELGTSSVGTTNPFAGQIYRAQVYDGIGGTLVFDADFQDTSTHGATRKTLTEKSSNAATVTIYSTSATATRVVDSLYFPLPDAVGVPKELTALLRFVEKGGITSAQNFWGISNAAGDAARIQISVSGGNYRFTSVQAGSVNSTPGSAPTIGQEVDFRMNLQSDGKVIAGISIDNAAEVLGSLSAAESLASSWSGQRIYVGAIGTTFPSYGAFRECVIARRTRTLAQLRKVG